jgi:hypothetical protein
LTLRAITREVIQLVEKETGIPVRVTEDSKVQHMSPTHRLGSDVKGKLPRDPFQYQLWLSKYLPVQRFPLWSYEFMRIRWTLDFVLWADLWASVDSKACAHGHQQTPAIETTYYV